MERGGLSRAVRTDKRDDFALFDGKRNAFERENRAVRNF